MSALKYQLPEIYHSLFVNKILNVSIAETLATCTDCAMSPDKEKGETTYQPTLKCCTFHPFQPNYLIGAVLKAQSAARDALKSIQNKIKNLEYALPIGIVAPLRHQVEFNHRKKHEFGNRQDWLCPYYDKEFNRCGIWRHRGAVCTTFFCKSSYGKKGMQFWDRMSDYLTYVEAALMEEALVMLDFSPRQISENLAYLNRFDATEEELKTNYLDKKKAIELWNGYFDDPSGFYIKSHEIICNLNKRQFKEVMGEQGLMLEKDLISSLNALESKK